MRQNTPISLPRQRTRGTAAAPLEGAGLPRAGGPDPARSLYIHVPFCFHKCHYCDFYSLVDTRDRQEAFLARLIGELGAIAPWSGNVPLRTIFVGGGTPSLLRVELWERLLGALRGRFDLSQMGRGPGEFTVECNPETVTPELMRALAGGGVNRVSIGAQSFQPVHLKTLERWHDPANVGRAVELARAAGIPRQSVDLIFAIPGQTLEDWRRDLQAALALGVSHMSCYNLTYEAGTAMTARRDRGEFAPADEETEVAMYETTLAVLRGAGLARYEVSNYARPGDEARHNLVYWRQEPWLAAGPSASGHYAGHRWKNTPRLDDYLTVDDRGFAPIAEHEAPDPQRAVSERIMTGLRLAEGLPVSEVAERLGGVPGRNGTTLDGLRMVAAGYAGTGHLAPAADRWTLTDSGFLIADAIAADFMAALDG
jgi:oxygen-independent coproporphyrinogen-3 oxidase